MSTHQSAEDEFRGPDALAIVAISGLFERVHYALVLAAAQAALGKPCTLFFSLHACQALTRSQGDPGWATMTGERGESAGAVNASYRERGVACFEELLRATADLGVRFMICEMGLRAMDIDEDDLRDDIPLEITGAVTFFSSIPSGASMLVV